MQTLWTRTLRAKCTCRCRQCASFSTAIARRVTNAAGRRSLALPSSTIIYSAIFAAAAVADGHAKQQRRDQWNAAIEDAKDQLRTERETEEKLGLDEEGVEGRAGEEVDFGKELAQEAAFRRDKESKEAEEYGPEEELDAIYLEMNEIGLNPDIVIEEPELPQSKAGELDISLWDEVQTYDMSIADRPRWPTVLGPPLVPSHLPPQSIYAPDYLKIHGLRSRWTRRKIQTMNLSMARLAARLMVAAKTYRVPRGEKPALRLTEIPESLHPIAKQDMRQLRNFLNQVFEMIHETKKVVRKVQDTIPEYPPQFGNYPHYQQDAAGEFHEKCHAMNKKIFDLFDSCAKGEMRLESLVVHLCDTLITCSAPPNVTTYNALLLGFSRLQQPKLCWLVMNSFHETHMRPDEITCCAMLRHHISTNRPELFSDFVQKMLGRARSSDVLMLARHNLKPRSVARATGRVVLHPHDPNKLVQKVFPSPKVFNAVVAGLLKFGGLERAVDLCADMAKEGWGFDAQGLTLFLGAAAEEQDWEAGQAIWTQLQVLRARLPRSERLDVRTYLKMLGLCWKCGRDAEFQSVFNEAVSVGYRKHALLKDFERMKKRGLDVFDRHIDRTAAHELARDAVATFVKEGRAISDALAARRGEGGLGEGGEGVLGEEVADVDVDVDVDMVCDAAVDDHGYTDHGHDMADAQSDDAMLDTRWLSTPSRHHHPPPKTGSGGGAGGAGQTHQARSVWTASAAKKESERAAAAAAAA